MILKVSVIICTYNPDRKIFHRVLSAVSDLILEPGQTEIIIVDNNSNSPVELEFHDRIKRFQIPPRIIKEVKPGLTNARIAGYKASSGDVLVFFDDDNEPDKHYVSRAVEVFQTFPCVGVFGPGVISVEFMQEDKPGWIQFYKGYFQEKNYNSPTYACIQEWMSFYPPGTGQCVRRIIFENYAEKINSGLISANDRTGKSLSSAGDVQIVFESINQNMAVGLFPDLRINHLIAESKSNQKYLCRLLFGMASSYPEAYAESFPEKRNLIPYHSDYQIFQKVVGCFFSYLVFRKSPRLFLIKLADLLGQIYGANCARGLNQDSFWFQLINVLKLR